MEDENNNTQTENVDKFERFEKSFSRVQTFLTPLAILILFIFNFGYGMRDTQASTGQQIEKLEKGQAAHTEQIKAARDERMAQIDDFKKEVKADIKGLEDKIDKQGIIQRQDIQRFDEKLDRLIDTRLR